jgi:hypothetical protein
MLTRVEQGVNTEIEVSASLNAEQPDRRLSSGLSAAMVGTATSAGCPNMRSSRRSGEHDCWLVLPVAVCGGQAEGHACTHVGHGVVSRSG